MQQQPHQRVETVTQLMLITNCEAVGLNLTLASFKGIFATLSIVENYSVIIQLYRLLAIKILQPLQ